MPDKTVNELCKEITQAKLKELKQKRDTLNTAIANLEEEIKNLIEASK